MENSAKCPFTGSLESGSQGTRLNPGTKNKDWWPHQVNLNMLKQHSEKSNPLGTNFDYRKAFESLDYEALKQDLKALLRQSEAWWPADFGHYGPLFIRLAWHAAGTYRIGDGRGGAAQGLQRFAPLNSWPDNTNLDKARRLLWPIKQKYGQSISWADLMILIGNVALEDMGFKTFGFSGGREDVWEADESIYWGAEKKWLDDSKRYSGNRELENPLAAVQMGLIYVNPEGPGGNPDPIAAAKDIRETFARMAMNDEETVALIAGGHTFGKAHGAVSPDNLEAEPEGASIAQQGFGWHNKHGKGKAEDTLTGGPELTWTTTPTKWSHDFFKHLFEFEWELTKSPAGAHQWVAKNAGEIIPDAHMPGKKIKPGMLTTDLALRFDPAYEKISRRFYENPQEFADAFAKAWYKLTHRDMGPKQRYLGPEVPQETLIWQDPLPLNQNTKLSEAEVAEIKDLLKKSGLSIRALVSLAWASASTFRKSDKRGGANGARIRLAPQKFWKVNNPAEMAQTISALEKIQTEFNQSAANGHVLSMADLIVLGGSTAIEWAAQKAGKSIGVPFVSGRVDATQEQTDVSSFEALEPFADGFRNYQKAPSAVPVEHLLIDRAQLLDLNPAEMTVLVGGLRVLNANTENNMLGVLSTRQETHSRDFFTTLLDMQYEWKAIDPNESHFHGHLRSTGEIKWAASRVDLLFGSNSELRAIAEVYASSDGEELFYQDFVKAWVKVMNHDLFI